MKIRDMMTTPVVRIHPEESVAVAARTLARNNIGILPVCGLGTGSGSDAGAGSDDKPGSLCPSGDGCVFCGRTDGAGPGPQTAGAGEREIVRNGESGGSGGAGGDQSGRSGCSRSHQQRCFGAGNPLMEDACAWVKIYKK